MIKNVMQAMSKILLPMFSSRMYMVLNLTFKSLIHLFLFLFCFSFFVFSMFIYLLMQCGTRQKDIDIAIDTTVYII